jgi:hypothetical protein
MKMTPQLKTLIALLALAPVASFFGSARTVTPTFALTLTRQTVATENIRLITATGIENFVRQLNDVGKLGYRVENSLSYGGEGETQNYAAVVRLDAPNKYEYDWMSSPNKKLLEERLNYQANRGFNFVNAYALTYCSGGTSEEKANPTSPESLILRLHKGDAFLMERRNGATEQSRAYKVFIAKVRLGDSAEKDLQAAIDAAAAEDFRPVKILFARQGLLDFSVSVMVEKDVKDNSVAKAEYRFLKKSSGLPKDINVLAAQGFRFITGRRVGLIGLALLAKRSSDATTYTFIDAKKYEKEFDKTVAPGNTYEVVMFGDLTCGSTEAENERLVFAQNANGEKHEYKIQTMYSTTAGSVDPNSLSEFQRLLGDGYRVKDLFYAAGLHVIFEK